MRRINRLAVFLILCMIWSCAERVEDNTEAAVWQEEQEEDKKVKTDADYLGKLARSGIFEVEISKLAVEKTAKPEIKKLAMMMIEHHTAMNAELEKLAAAKEISLPAEMSGKKMEKIQKAREQEGEEFDKRLMGYLIKDHEKNIELVQKIAENTKDADIKAWAIKSLPVLKKHLEEAKKIDEMMSDKKSA